MRAAYMAETGKYLEEYISVFQWTVDYNFKPPLITVLQAKFLQLLPGNPELALRLPTGISMLLIVLVFLRWSRIFKLPVTVGMTAGLVLLTSNIVARDHLSRTGDHDAPLMFLTTLSFWIFFEFLITKNRLWETIGIVLMVLVLYAAFLTKSFIGLLFVPVFFAALIKTHGKRILLDFRYWFGGFLLTGLIAFYYYSMNQAHPGYWDGVINHTLGRYSTNLFQEPVYPFYFYFKELFLGFQPWILFIPWAFSFWISGQKNDRLEQPVRLLFYASLFVILVMSFSQSKRIWYIAPVYPLLSFLAALGIMRIIGEIRKASYFRKKNRLYFHTVIGISLFLLPVWNTIERIMYPANDQAIEQYGYLVEELHQKGISKYKIFTLGSPVPAFYRYYYNQFMDADIELAKSVDQLNKNDLVLLIDRIEDNPQLIAIMDRFELNLERRKKDVAVYKILKKR